MTTILLVRHGQTEWNRVERFRGRATIQLNDNGLEQARQTAVWISKMHKPTAVFSSPMARAMQTAMEIAQPLGLKVVSSEGLNDIDYGKWQGLTPQEVRAEWPELMAEWNRHPENVQIPNGETLRQVQERAMETVYQICDFHPSSEILLVSHTVVIRLILLKVLGLGMESFLRIHQDPCGVNVFSSEGSNFILHRLNCCHYS